MTLSQFCTRNSIAHLHLAMCDAEGHDFKVLSGAKDLLQASRIDVFRFEYKHRWIGARCYLKDVFDLVQGLPYRVARVCPGKIQRFTPTGILKLDRFFEANYLLVHENAPGWFDAGYGIFDDANSFAP